MTFNLPKVGKRYVSPVVQLSLVPMQITLLILLKYESRAHVIPELVLAIKLHLVTALKYCEKNGPTNSRVHYSVVQRREITT